MSQLTIIDASACIKGGTHMGISKPISCNGLQIGGLVAILRQVMLCLNRGQQVMVAFDSPTIRKDIMPEYKGNRNLDFDFGIQRSLAWIFLNELGIHCVKYEGYEADDLIVYATRVNYSKYDKIVIITNDLDLTQLVDSKGKVETQSPTTQAPSVNRRNFELILGAKRKCEFNTVLINKLIWGDSSDNIKVFEVSGGSQMRIDLEQELIKLAKSMTKEPCNWNGNKVIFEWLKSDSKLLKGLASKELEDFKRRFIVFYPIKAKPEFKETLVCKEMNRIKIEEARKICTILNNGALADQWHCGLGNRTDEMVNFIYALKNIRKDLAKASEEGIEIPWSLASIENITKRYIEMDNPVDTGVF